MKKMKRLVALALSVVMVLAMSVFAFADETSQTFTITAPTDSQNNHTYEVYQIFTAKLTTEEENGESKQILSDVKWGKNGTGNKGTSVDAKILNEIKNASGDDTAKLEIISKHVDLKSDKYGEVSKSKNLKVPAGYYLIKDVDNSLKDESGKPLHDSYTKYIVQVANDITISPKADKPSVEKKVQENKKYQDDKTYGTGYNDTADYNIGDMVPFELIGTVPDMSQYKAYKYTFHDTLSEAFDNVDKQDIKVYVADNKKGEKETYITDKFNITSSGNQITVFTDNLKGIEGVSQGKFIIVRYSAKLNSNAAIGQGTVKESGQGNINKVYLTYSNNPNQGGEDEEGKTPEDVVIVFTYQLVTNKVDGQDESKKLSGVTFKLYRQNGDKKEWAIVDNESKKLTGWTTTEADGTTLTSDENGQFKVIGLDAGTYYIHEIATLSGYNKLENDVTVVIKANTSNGQAGAGQVTELEELNVKVDTEQSYKGEKETGTASITIKNNKGSNLPSTGGIGTTIFYIVGGILMVGAAVLLITKRRAEN